MTTTTCVLGSNFVTLGAIMKRSMLVTNSAGTEEMARKGEGRKVW